MDGVYCPKCGSGRVEGQVENDEDLWPFECEACGAAWEIAVV